jgi:high-affinity nickel-transport protein
VVHEKFGLSDPVTGWIAGLNLDSAGHLIVALFVVVWAAALSFWRFTRVEERWAARVPAASD